MSPVSKKGRELERPDPSRLLTLEGDCVPRDYDMPREMVVEVTSQFDIRRLVDQVVGKTEAEARDAFSDWGKAVMQRVFELADGTYRDRTADMIEKVAAITGIRFPHVLQRYVELWLLSSRPTDKYNITRATTRELHCQVYTCSTRQALDSAGYRDGGLACRVMCLDSFGLAAGKVDLDIDIGLARTLPEEGVCEFRFKIRG